MPIIDKLNKAIVAVESKPDFQQKFLINKGLTPSLESAEQFAKELPADRAEGLAVIKASGLYPSVSEAALVGWVERSETHRRAGKAA